MSNNSSWSSTSTSASTSSWTSTSTSTSTPTSTSTSLLDCNRHHRTGNKTCSSTPTTRRSFRKLNSEELKCSPAPDVKIGQRVAYKLYYGNEFGTIRWIGRVPQISSDWTVGVEFDNAIGEGDGSLNGRRYFIAKDCFAKFLPLDIVCLVEQHVGRPEPGTMISVMSAASKPGQMISIQRVSTVHVQHCFLNAPHHRPGPELPLLAVNTRLHCQCPNCGPCAHVIKPPRTQRLARPSKNATHMCQFSTYTCCGMTSQDETMCAYRGNKETDAALETLTQLGNSWIAGAGYLSELQAQQSSKSALSKNFNINDKQSQSQPQPQLQHHSYHQPKQVHQNHDLNLLNNYYQQEEIDRQIIDEKWLKQVAKSIESNSSNQDLIDKSESTTFYGQSSQIDDNYDHVLVDHLDLELELESDLDKLSQIRYGRFSLNNWPVKNNNHFKSSSNKIAAKVRSLISCISSSNHKHETTSTLNKHVQNDNNNNNINWSPNHNSNSTSDPGIFNSPLDREQQQYPTHLLPLDHPQSIINDNNYNKQNHIIMDQVEPIQNNTNSIHSTSFEFDSDLGSDYCCDLEPAYNNRIMPQQQAIQGSREQREHLATNTTTSATHNLNNDREALIAATTAKLIELSLASDLNSVHSMAS